MFADLFFIFWFTYWFTFMQTRQVINNKLVIQKMQYLKQINGIYYVNIGILSNKKLPLYSM